MNDINSKPNDKKSKEKIIKLSQLLNILGESYFKTKDFQKSIKALSESIELNPNNLVSYKNIINVYNKIGNTQKTNFFSDRLSKLISHSKDND